MTAKTQVKNIHQRILGVMAEIDYIAKTDKKVNNQYTFVTHDAVTAKIHPQLVKHGISLIPDTLRWGQEGNRTWAEIELHVINADKPDDRFSLRSLGYGIDSQDKGPGKAVSYAYKYALLKLFALETGDDPERDLVEFDDGKIDEKQFETIQGLIDDLGAGSASLCAAYKIDAVKDLPADQFNHVVDVLNKRISKKLGKAA